MADITKVLVRLPSDLAVALGLSAGLSGWSRNAEIVQRLVDSYSLEAAVVEAAPVRGASQRDAAAHLPDMPSVGAAAPLKEEPPTLGVEGSVALGDPGSVPRSVGITSVPAGRCPRVQFHRRGEWCKYCVWSG